MNQININYEKVQEIISRGRTISTMESCTGGMLASAITDCSGASEVYQGGLVTYSNRAKTKQNVAEEIIEKYGVYSAQTAEAMAKACAEIYDTEIGIGVTGSLGRKDPANPDSIVGEVYYSIYERGNTEPENDSTGPENGSADGTAEPGTISTTGKFTTAKIKIPDELTERPEMKKYIINEILNQISS